MQRFLAWVFYTDYAAEVLLLFGKDERAGLEHGLLGHLSFDGKKRGVAADDGSLNQLRAGRLVANPIRPSTASSVAPSNSMATVTTSTRRLRRSLTAPPRTWPQ